MGTALGFKFNEDVNVYRHTVGNLGTAGAPTSIPLVDGPTITNNGATILTKGWDSSVAILKQNDIVSFAGAYAVNPISYRNVGKLRTFVVTADVTSVGAAGTINISRR